MERADQHPDGKPGAGAEQARNWVVREEINMRHCLCIHRQADQNPITTPSSNKGALQKIPVPKVWSSQRPMKRPSKVGATMTQPSTPI